jgi:hypothetical protein
MPPPGPPTEGMPPTGGPPPYAAPAAAGGGGGSGKIIAIIVVVALLAGGAAFLLTRSSGSSGGSQQSFCDTAKKVQNDAELGNAFDDPAKIDKTLTAFQQLTDAAPSEIKSDMETINDALKKIGAAVKSAGSDQGKQLSAVLAAVSSLDQAKLEQASQNVDKFAKDKCGIDLSVDSSSNSAGSNNFTDFGSDFSSFSDFGSDFSTNFGSDFSSFFSDFGSSFGSDFSSLFSSGN